MHARTRACFHGAVRHRIILRPPQRRRLGLPVLGDLRAAAAAASAAAGRVDGDADVGGAQAGAGEGDEVRALLRRQKPAGRSTFV